jgi:chloride channel 3/4/5
MFLKLGLKYVIFLDRGSLKGILTKKDVWYVLNNVDIYECDEDMESAELDAQPEATSEEHGLLASESEPALINAYDNR